MSDREFSHLNQRSYKIIVSLSQFTYTEWALLTGSKTGKKLQYTLIISKSEFKNYRRLWEGRHDSKMFHPPVHVATYHEEAEDFRCPHAILSLSLSPTLPDNFVHRTTVSRNHSEPSQDLPDRQGRSYDASQYVEAERYQNGTAQSSHGPFRQLGESIGTRGGDETESSRTVPPTVCLPCPGLVWQGRCEMRHTFRPHHHQARSPRRREGEAWSW